MGGELGLEISGEQIVGWAGEHGVLLGCNLDEQRLESVIHLEMKQGDPPGDIVLCPLSAARCSTNIGKGAENSQGRKWDCRSYVCTEYVSLFKGRKERTCPWL